MSARDDVVVTSRPARPEPEFEIVERKGLGHPDTICDLVMDDVGQALGRAYLERCGAMLHHNCDKALLVAGRSEVRFGGGRILEPMTLVMGDRASPLPPGGAGVDEIAVEAARDWFRRNLRHIDRERHIRIRPELRPGSAELSELFRGDAAVGGANDTSAAVGYAPLTETERIVLEAEGYLNSPAFKSRFPQTGEDVKVLAVRRHDRLDLTVAMPLLDRNLHGEDDYFEVKHAVTTDLLERVRESAWQIGEIELRLNALDRRGAGASGAYLTVIGTSAEAGDSGQVGRGNRASGLIAFNRPSGMEATAGKNPTRHVGKIYGVFAFHLAGRLHAVVPGVEQATVWMASRIGDPVDRPALVAAELGLAAGTGLADVEALVRERVTNELARLPQFCRELALGRHRVC